MANNFKLTLDTLAPQGGFINTDKLPRYANYAFTLEINKGDATHMAIWADEYDESTLPEIEWIEAATSFTIDTYLIPTGQDFYYHLVLKDDVNNKSEVYTVGPFIYDDQNPSFEIDESTQNARLMLRILDNDDNCYTNQITNLNLTFNAYDAGGSGFAKAVVSGDDIVEYEIAFEGEDTVAYNGTFSFNADVVDGEKTLTVKLYDRAGNFCEATTNKLILDRVIADPVLVLYEDDYHQYTVSDTYTRATGVFFDLYLGSDHLDQYSDNIAKYKVWEEGVSTEESAEWVDVSTDQSYYHDDNMHSASDGTTLDLYNNSFSTPYLELSTGDGWKTVKAKIMDAAGNESKVVESTVFVDTTAPSISGIEAFNSSNPDLTVVSPHYGAQYVYIHLNNFVEEGSGIRTFMVTRKVYDLQGNDLYQDEAFFNYDSTTSGGVDLEEYLNINYGYWYKESVNHIPAGTIQVTDDISMLSGGDCRIKYVAYIVDNVGNEFYSDQEGIVSNDIDVDDTAPTIELDGQLKEWYNTTEPFGVTATIEDWHEIINIKAYVNDVEVDWTPASEFTKNGNTWTIKAEQIDFTAMREYVNEYDGTDNKLHIEVEDIAGNIGTGEWVFGYDATAPQIVSAKFTKAVYNGENAAIEIMATDYIAGSSTESGSGVEKVQLTGNILDASDEWVNAASSFNVRLTSGDGIKTVFVKVKDAAGNISSTTVECELDTVKPTIAMNLYELERDENDELVLANQKTGETALRTFTAQIDASDYCAYNPENGTVELCKLYYKIYGDIVTINNASGIVSEGQVAWAEFVPVAGQTYMLVTGECTGGDGLKNIYLSVTDTAGNTNTIETPCTFTLDETLPSVTITNLDHNRISTVHEVREICLDTTGTHGKVDENLSYADEVKFTITPDSVIQAWKVCAYLDKADATSGTAEDNSILSAEAAKDIAETERSINMEGSGVRVNAPIECLIKGVDFENALLARAGKSTHGEVDGIHYVVVYVQDIAGLWSKVEEKDLTL